MRKLIMGLFFVAVGLLMNAGAEARGRYHHHHHFGHARHHHHHRHHHDRGHHRYGVHHHGYGMRVHGRHHRHRMGEGRSFGEHAAPYADAGVSSSGLASWYRGRTGGLTAAHRFYPFGTRVLVTNRDNGRTVIVRINDRGPFIRGRVIDLNRSAASAIGVTGVSPVTLRRL